MGKLKIARLALSVLIFSLISLIFLDYYRVTPVWLKSCLTSIQLVPSMLKSDASASSCAGLVIVLVVTLLFGRIYCSFICPLGFCQDVFIRLGKKFRKRPDRGYSSPHNALFYSILVISAISVFISGTALLLWLDPFSIFGRFMTYVASRMLFSANNLVASALIEKNIFIINSISIRPSVAGGVFALSVFSVIMTLSAFRGRIYCNTVCPAGALLSLVSRASLFKISFKGSSCLNCGKCESACKSSCIDYRSMNVDFARCVACYNCIGQCPGKSIGYGIRYTSRSGGKADSEKTSATVKGGGITRLNFISGLLVLPEALTAKSDDRLYYQDPSKQVKFTRKHFSSPPGSLSAEAFNGSCTACSLCVSVCPTSVLQPAVMHYGLTGIMQPFMDFNSGYCNYDCTLCGEVCPTGAIKKVAVEDKKLIQTGKSSFIRENCITYTNGTDCGACSEHCPTKAVHMVPFRNGLVIPEVNTEICTGCGACEHVCPVRPYRAIYVDGNTVHAAAKLPEVKKKKEIKKSDFPF